LGCFSFLFRPPSSDPLVQTDAHNKLIVFFKTCPFVEARLMYVCRRHRSGCEETPATSSQNSLMRQTKLSSMSSLHFAAAPQGQTRGITIGHLVGPTSWLHIIPSLMSRGDADTRPAGNTTFQGSARTITTLQALWKRSGKYYTALQRPFSAMQCDVANVVGGLGVTCHRA
jgi:hypothetical protein